MEYQAPNLRTPEEVYQTPLLLDLEELSAAETPCCDTGGGGCTPQAG